MTQATAVDPLTLPEWRCTRNSMYSPTSLGANDLTVRQGHYIRAATAEDARKAMAKRFPKDAKGFTADFFKPPFRQPTDV